MLTAIYEWCRGGFVYSMENKEAEAEFTYRLVKLFVINLYRRGVISAGTAERLRDDLIRKYNPPIGILEEGQKWEIEI